MDYREEHTWPLTTSTSCYTGACYRQHRTKDDDDNAGVIAVRFATENHTCRIATTDDNDNNPKFTSNQVVVVASEESNMICVGYSAWSDWEALALLDASKMMSSNHQNNTSSNNELPLPPIQQQQQQVVSSPSVVVEDGSVGVAGAGTASSLSVASHHRRSSSFLSTYSEASLPPRLVSQFSASGNSVLGESTDLESILLNDETAADMTAVQQRSDQRGIIGQLILRHYDNQTEYSTTLDFRPLAVTVCEFSATCNDDNDSDLPEKLYNNNKMGVWLGSADNNKLHCFVPAKTDIFRSSSENTLIPVTLSDDSAFSFLTPIMAIDYLAAAAVDDDRHYLAVACQDGTVRLICFRLDDTNEDDNGNDELSPFCFRDIRQYQVIIDGPIVCLHLQNNTQPHNNKRIVHLTVGSLCGYVAELYLDTTSAEASDWEGPFMVAEGFWNCRLNVEDSVLAVCADAAHGTVLLGTHLGRCVLYKKEKEANSNIDNKGGATPMYQLQWECRLPYPIHAVSFLANDRLLITTRKSVHIFRRHDHRLSIDDDKKSSIVAAAASRAKERLLKILAEQKRQQQQQQEHSKSSLLEEKNTQTEETS